MSFGEQIRRGVRPGAADAERPIRATGLRPAELAFFLDVDGTLLEIAASPDEVVVGGEVLTLLRALVARCGGAVAFVSGRSIVALDELFRPLVLPASGLHGFERRNSDGDYLRLPLPSGVLLSRGRHELQQLLEQHPDLLLEDKRYALALHYRKLPHLEEEIVAQVKGIVEYLAPDFELQQGRCVAEIRPAAGSKAAAIADFMAEAPFRGRRPVCLGDDLTDECAFEWVNAAGGLSVAVGVEQDSAAQAHLQSVQAARRWLRHLVEEV